MEQVITFFAEFFKVIGDIINWLIGATHSTQGFLVSMGVSHEISWAVVIILWLIILYPMWKVFTPILSIRGDRAIIPENKRDAKRVFTTGQKNIIYNAVGNRCEHRSGPFGIIRCKVKGSKNLNGDHWFPHAKGGATSTRNCVALCENHNQKKSSKTPTKMQTLTLSMWRRVYMTKHITPGQWK